MEFASANRLNSRHPIPSAKPTPQFLTPHSSFLTQQSLTPHSSFLTPSHAVDREAYARLTAPQHITESHFLQHEKIEGFFENRDVPEFIGSDRLLKMDTIYGTIQLGYNPRKGQSFIFANIKTSIYDTAPYRHQRELKEYQMMRALKTGTQNQAFSAKRRGASAAILYKMEPLPWSRRSVEPYLFRANMQALEKTMPFLDRSGEVMRREDTVQELRKGQEKLREQLAGGDTDGMRATRAKGLELSARQDQLNALLYRKDAQRRLFFRKLNASLDMQKHEMFAYYRDIRLRGGVRAAETAPADTNKQDEDEDE